MSDKKLTTEEVKHVAKLSRIELSDAEVGKFRGQLSKILQYIDKINEIDTEDVEPTWQVTGLKNVLREDRVDDCNCSDELIEAAPESEGRQIKVKSVLK